MHPVKEKVALFSQENGLFHNGDRVLVAVSGGIDSVTLLHLLSEPSWSLDLKAVYVHHGLRSEADEEAEWVCRYAERLGISSVVQHIEVRKIAEQRGESIQMAARNERYHVLKAMATSWGAKRIALGHHANDQAETVLLRLLTGTSLPGLAGMTPQRGRLIRPLLTVYREEIASYAKDNGLEWREDSSNRDTHYLRNRIRLELLPNLAQLQPQIVGHLVQLAEMAGEWRDWQDEALKATEAILDWEVDNEAVSWSYPVWLGLPRPLQRAVLKRAFYSLNSDQRLEYAHQMRILGQFCREDQQGKIQLPGAGFLTRSGQRLVLQRPPASDLEESKPISVRVKIPGETSWQGGVLEARWITQNQMPAHWQTAGVDEAFFAISQGVPELFLRGRKEGDRMRVFGGTKLEKVKKLLIDAKVARFSRGLTPILVDEKDQIWWIVGVRHGETARVQPGDERILYLKYIKIPDGAVR